MSAVAQVEERLVKPYGEKALRFINRHPKNDKRINILEGAVRSSKTWTMIPKFLQLCHYKVGGQKILTGVSKQTIYNNVLNDLFEVIGPQNYTYNRQSGELDVMGAKWLVIGAKDEGSEKYVRGLTVGVCYDDELTLQPRSFQMMTLNRMSPDGARKYSTTNPDSPHHYVKTDIIDNERLRERGDIFVEHFTLDDNPNLTEDTKAYLRNLYVGVYKLRFIDGLWVVAEGAIYGSCWSEDLIYEDGERKRLGVERGVVVDCGVDHPQVYLDVIDDGETLWFEREYFWDSKARMQQKTDRQYADDLEKFLKKAPGAQVIIPPECASFEAELVQRGIWLGIADNDVSDGLRMTSSMMALRRIRFKVNKRCRNRDTCICGGECLVHTVKEIPSYAWDPKKSERGLEEPIKLKDDTCDCVRYYVKTKVAPWRIAA